MVSNNQQTNNACVTPSPLPTTFPQYMLWVQCTSTRLTWVNKHAFIGGVLSRCKLYSHNVPGKMHCDRRRCRAFGRTSPSSLWPAAIDALTDSKIIHTFVWVRHKATDAVWCSIRHRRRWRCTFILCVCVFFLCFVRLVLPVCHIGGPPNGGWE